MTDVEYDMTEYRKKDEALAALSPEEFRVTQESSTERPAPAIFE